jgi:hypothetical protein
MLCRICSAAEKKRCETRGCTFEGRFEEWIEHVQNCVLTQCIFEGCPFEGPSDLVYGHMDFCGYDKSRGRAIEDEVSFESEMAKVMRQSLLELQGDEIPSELQSDRVNDDEMWEAISLSMDEAPKKVLEQIEAEDDEMLMIMDLSLKEVGGLENDNDQPLPQKALIDVEEEGETADSVQCYENSNDDKPVAPKEGEIKKKFFIEDAVEIDLFDDEAEEEVEF